MGLSDWLFGNNGGTYDATSQQAQQAATTNGSYGATNNLQGIATGQTQAPTMQAAQLNTGNYDQDRSQQQTLASQLGQQAQGKGPSAAVNAGNASRDAALTQASALNAGRRGANAGAGALAGAQASSQGIQQANQTQATGQASEMAAASQAQAGVLSGMAGQDTSVANANAGYQQGANANNQNATLQQQSQQLQANQQLQQQAEAEMQARQQEQGYTAQTMNQGGTGVVGGLAGAAPGIAAAAMSDRRGKTDVRRVSSGGLGAALFQGRSRS